MCPIDPTLRKDDPDTIWVEGSRRYIRVSQGQVKIGCSTVTWDDVEKVQKAIERWKASPVMPFVHDLRKPMKAGIQDEY